MKKLLMENTETATSLGKWNNNLSSNDGRYVKEKLYRKKNGEFFLYSEGGCLSKYSVSIGTNSWAGDCTISSLSEEEAYDWAMEHLNASVFEEIFGVISDDENHLLTICITEELFQKLSNLSQLQNKSIVEIITGFINCNL